LPEGSRIEARALRNESKSSSLTSQVSSLRNRRALDFRAVNHAVDLAPHEEHGAGQIEPDHQDDDAPDGPVRFIVAPEVFDVEPKALADDHPAANGERAARRQPVPGKFQAGDHAIDHGGIQPQTAADHSPADAAAQNSLQHGD